MGFILACVIAVPLRCDVRTFDYIYVGNDSFHRPFSSRFRQSFGWLIALIIVRWLYSRSRHPLVNRYFGCMSITAWLEVNPAFIASAITVAMCSLWATLVNTALGVASVDKDHMNVARVLKLQFHQRLIKIILPSACHWSSLVCASPLGVGWMVLIAAEWLANSQGLGCTFGMPITVVHPIRSP